MNYSTYSKLYNACVVPVIDYAASIWGYKNFTKPNTIQNKAMRIYLGVHRFAPVAGLEGDMGWLSPQYRRWLEMLRFWNRLISLEDTRLTKKLFNHMHSLSREADTDWCGNIRSILSFINLREYFDNRQQVNIESCRSLLLAKQRESWIATVSQKPKLRFYSLFKSTFTSEKYVEISLSSYERSVLAQIRLGILKIHVETGRFNNTKLEDRLCNICNQNVIEDEFHFLFHCNAYDIPRNNFINIISNACPEFHYLEDKDQLKFIFEEIPRATAKFIISCLNIRKDILYN